MKISLFVFIGNLLILCSCVQGNNDPSGQSTKPVQSDTLAKHELDYITEFKEVFFVKCLKYGFATETFKQELRKDCSLSLDYALGAGRYELIDSIALIYRQKIIKDSIGIAEFGYEGTEGCKPVFTICLQGYESKMLDSIVRAVIK